MVETWSDTLQSLFTPVNSVRHEDSAKSWTSEQWLCTFLTNKQKTTSCYCSATMSSMLWHRSWLSPDLFIFTAFSIFFVKLYVSRRRWFAVIALIRALHEKTIQHFSLLIIFTIVFMMARHALYELVVYTVTALKLGLNFMTTVFFAYWQTQKWNKLTNRSRQMITERYKDYTKHRWMTQWNTHVIS